MRNYPISLKLNKEERHCLDRRCNDLEMNISDYIRKKIFEPEEIGWKEVVVKFKKWLLEEKGNDKLGEKSKR